MNGDSLHMVKNTNPPVASDLVGREQGNQNIKKHPPQTSPTPKRTEDLLEYYA